jgi:hypothetical protein
MKADTSPMMVDFPEPDGPTGPSPFLAWLERDAMQDRLVLFIGESHTLELTAP